MAETDTWKFRAYVVPVLGKPISSGDTATVVSAVTRMLRDHPGYRVALRSVSHGKVESHHSIILSTSIDRKIKVTPRPPDGRSVNEQQLLDDEAEIVAVLTNLGISIHDPGEF